MAEHPIPRDEWAVIVSNVPIVSVDLIVRVGNGVVLGKRANAPAKGQWFVPGGRVRKHERRVTAVHRIAQQELGVGVEINDCLGTYEHFYDETAVPGLDGKHYVATGYLVVPVDDGFSLDDQHEAIRVFEPPIDVELHPYIQTYLQDAGIVP